MSDPAWNLEAYHNGLHTCNTIRAMSITKWFEIFSKLRTWVVSTPCVHTCEVTNCTGNLVKLRSQAAQYLHPLVLPGYLHYHSTLIETESKTPLTLSSFSPCRHQLWLTHSLHLQRYKIKVRWAMIYKSSSDSAIFWVNEEKWHCCV